MRTRIAVVLPAMVLLSMALVAQTAGQASGPARSQDETVSLGYLHTVVNAQKNYKKKHGEYATSQAALVHSGSFTKRMATTDRGAYTVHFLGKPDAYSLSLTPKQFSAERRAFYVDEGGKVRVEENKPATEESPLLR